MKKQILVLILGTTVCTMSPVFAMEDLSEERSKSVWSSKLVNPLQQQTLFEKARAAVRSHQLCKDYIIGINTAEALVRARSEAPLCTVTSVELQKLLAELVSHFPATRHRLKIISGPLTWQDYRFAVEEIINWKTPQDSVIRHGYCGSNPSKNPVNLEYPDYFRNTITSVRQGFIPKPHGTIGELVILLCLAHNIAPYGFPLKFEGNYRDVLSADTTSFVEHDHGHHHNVYGREFKRNWILSGGLEELLHKVPFTSELVHYMFDKFWDNSDMLFQMPPWMTEKFGDDYPEKTYPYFADIYLSLHGSNPFETKEELQKGLVSFVDGSPSWEGLSIVFKHFSDKKQVGKILRHLVEPLSPLLKKMKEWGLVYDREKISDRSCHPRLFLDLVIFLDQQGEATWELLDQAFSEGHLTHKPDAGPYKIMALIKKIIGGEKK